MSETTWDQSDERLFTLKLAESSRQMNEKTELAKKRIYFEHQKSSLAGGTQALYLALIDCQIVVLHEYLESVDRVCREVWEVQARTITSVFVRTILTNKISEAIAARTGAIRHGIELTLARTKEQTLSTSPVLHHLVWETQRLQANMQERYEIEAITLDKKAAIAVPKKTAPIAITEQSDLQNEPRERNDRGMMLQFDLWRNFKDKFKWLANEERATSQRESKDHSLRAHCSYENHPEVIEAEKIEQGRFCLLRTPECGLWIFSGGPNENFQAEFRALATRAGRALGCPQGSLPEDFWLHNLFLDLLENKSNQLFAAEKDKGGIILHVCTASATFCSRLEKSALEASALVPKPAARTADGDLSERKLDASAARPHKKIDAARSTRSNNKRRSFVLPLLRKGGLSIHDWANKARVDFHTANHYLRGKTDPRPSTRKKLAESLGVEVEKLPR